MMKRLTQAVLIRVAWLILLAQDLELYAWLRAVGLARLDIGRAVVNQWRHDRTLLGKAHVAYTAKTLRYRALCMTIIPPVEAPPLFEG